MTQKRANEIQDRTRELVEYPPSKLWTYEELADHCSVSYSTIERLVRDGKLQAIPMRGSIRIPHSSFIDFLRRAQADADWAQTHRVTPPDAA